MDIDKSWQEMKRREAGFVQEQLALPTTRRSRNPLATLKRNLVVSLVGNLVITLICTYYVFLFSVVFIKALLLMGVVESLYSNWKIYQRTKALSQSLEDVDQPILDTVRQQLGLLRRTIRMIEHRALLFLPFGYLAGLLIGGSSDGMPADELLKNPLFLIQGMAFSLLIMPLLYFCIKWINKKAFGDYINQTENMLKEWES